MILNVNVIDSVIVDVLVHVNVYDQVKDIRALCKM